MTRLNLHERVPVDTPLHCRFRKRRSDALHLGQVQGEGTTDTERLMLQRRTVLFRHVRVTSFAKRTDVYLVRTHSVHQELRTSAIHPEDLARVAF